MKPKKRGFTCCGQMCLWVKGGLGTQGQGLTCQAGLGVSTVNEEVAWALREQREGGKLEHPRHQAAGQQQGPGPWVTQELPGEAEERPEQMLPCQSPAH